MEEQAWNKPGRCWSPLAGDSVFNGGRTKCFPQEKEGLMGMQACEEVLEANRGKEEKGNSY